MSQNTTIEWTDATWNPVLGCTRVSAGCVHCYAEIMAARVANSAQAKLDAGEDITETQRLYRNVVRWKDGKALPRWSGNLVLDESKLEEPLRWRKPRRVFVNSMSDLWHEKLSANDQIRRVYSVMRRCPHHVFQVLTKRPERRRKTFELWGRSDGLEHIWEGTSIESADHLERLEHLRQTPAAVRFLSLEPLLGPLGKFDLTGIHWVIAGGESGHGARPCHPDWVREIRDQCQAQGVAFFFKQWGAWAPFVDNGPLPADCRYIGPLGEIREGDPEDMERDVCMGRVGKKAAGAELDGREWREFPTPRPAQPPEPGPARPREPS